MHVGRAAVRQSGIFSAVFLLRPFVFFCRNTALIQFSISLLVVVLNYISLKKLKMVLIENWKCGSITYDEKKTIWILFS